MQVKIFAHKNNIYSTQQKDTAQPGSGAGVQQTSEQGRLRIF